ncbi:unnamed protein product [Rhizophagus irregularis]|nr:unnamed protein product [Rhizophagus irregularis]
MYSKRHKRVSKMELSLNCFVLGDNDTFTAVVPKKYISDSNLTEIVYSALTVSNFTKIIENQVEHAVPNPKDPNIESSTTPKREKIGDVLLLGTEVKKTPRLKLFKTIRRKNGTTITIKSEEIRKSINVANIMDLEFHMDLYTRILKGHYEHITYKESRGRINLTYGPVGYLCTPKNEDELRYAIYDILEIVSKLHREEVVHRDIRWDNVVKLTNGKWLLIDFEEAARIGDERDTLIISAPEYENGTDTCQASGDIWMIGKLMNEVKFTLSEKAQNFRDKLMIKDFNLRLTATDALKDDWIEEMRCG